MRYLTFLREQSKLVSFQNEEIITFEGWIDTTGYLKKNPHAGVPQIFLFLQIQNVSDTVRMGFVKSCLAYQKEPKNMLPTSLKDVDALKEWLGVM